MGLDLGSSQAKTLCLKWSVTLLLRLWLTHPWLRMLQLGQPPAAGSLSAGRVRPCSPNTLTPTGLWDWDLHQLQTAPAGS